MKRCLRKTLRNSKLTYEKFSTILTEVEGFINSRSLIYGVEEVGEVLTPSHLLFGRWIMGDQARLRMLERQSLI